LRARRHHHRQRRRHGGSQEEGIVSQAVQAGRTPPTASTVPPWLANLASLGWRLAVIAAFLVVAWELCTLLWTVTAAIAVAVVVSALFAPWAQGLRQRGRSRNAAAALVWVGALAVMVLVLLLLGLMFLPYLADLVAATGAAIDQLRTQLASIHIPPQVADMIASAVDTLRASAAASASGFVSSAAGVVTMLVLASFLVFFFLRDGDRAWAWCFQAAEADKRARITAAGEVALQRVGGYLRGTTVLSAVIAATDLAFMLILGVPMAGPLAVLVFLSGYIPYFGGIVTTFLIVIVTYGTLGIGPVIALLVMIAIRNAIVGYAVRPMVYGRTVSIHPALVLIALPAGLQLAGIVGLFAAVPVTAVILAVASATREILEPVPAPALPGMVPAWVDRVAQWCWRLLVALVLVALVVAMFTAVPMVLIPVVLAVILAATFSPVIPALERRGRSRSQAAAIAIGGGFAVITLAIVLAVGVLAGQSAALVGDMTSGAGSANDAVGGHLGLLASAVGALGAEGVRTVASVVSDFATLAVYFLLATLLAFYFLRDGAMLWGRILQNVRADAVEPIRGAGSRAFEVLAGYMFGTAAISLVGATSQLVIMVILGIPLALPIFVLSFFLCFIPYIGGFISTGLAFLLTVAVGSPSAIVVMAVWTLVFNIVTGNIVSPLVYGKTVHLHPAVVLVAIPAGSAVAGIMGMFLVVPALGVVAATWRTVLGVMASRSAREADLGFGAAAGPPDARAPEAPGDIAAPGPAPA
jgi:putative heme transporter